MAERPDHNKQYTAQDFERYYAGQMTAQEMHALEKAALGDPFLADALEGYKRSATPAADAALLKERLAAKVTTLKGASKKNPARLMPLLRIAALVLLLAGAGWSIYYFTRTEEHTVAIQREEKQQAPAAAEAETRAVADSSPASDLMQQERAVEEEAVATAPRRRIAPQNPAKKREAVEDKAEKVNDLEASSVVTAPLQSQAQPAPADSDIMALSAIQPGIAVAQNTFKGRVVDEQNNPVPNASVTMNDKRSTTVTDINGQFVINTPDSTLTATVNAIGFVPRQLRLNKETDSQRVVLQGAEGALSEVVVVGHDNRRQRKEARGMKAAGAAEPQGGWERFNEYIAQNLKKPENEQPLPPPGVVRLSFDVNDQGEPVNIEVEASLCGACDREAIRLLQEGPKWEKKKGKKGKVTIRF